MDNIIFIFSLPRSGSTLLQRLLSSHSKISTVSEPWLLLPFIYANKHSGVLTEYNHGWASDALKDFIEQLPGKKNDYYQELGKFAFSLYNKISSPDSKYFIDKTPRYYLIIPQITKLFPEAKFIFLFRNPLQVLASVITSFNRGSLRLHQYHIDLYRGPKLLAEGYMRLKDKSIAIDFDQLIQSTDFELKRIFDYLELNFENSSPISFQMVKLNGCKGDKVGYFEYSQVENQVTEKWEKVLASKYRKKFARKYIQRLGNDTLTIFGQDRNDLWQMIDRLETPQTGNIKDRYDLFIGNFLRIFELPMFARKINLWKSHGSSFSLYR